MDVPLTSSLMPSISDSVGGCSPFAVGLGGVGSGAAPTMRATDEKRNPKEIKRRRGTRGLGVVSVTVMTILNLNWSRVPLLPLLPLSLSLCLTSVY